MISVIIPTYNESEDLINCLESLRLQTEKNLEIIVVDDGSSDSTIRNLKNLRTEKLKVISQQHKGPGAARNLGAKKAKGEILVFVDADMTFDKDFLKNLSGPIVNGESKGTFSKEEYVSNWDNVWARCWNINEGWELKRRHSKNYPNTQPVFRAILKSEFDKVGGFTPGGYDDDWSLGKKLGYEATMAPNAIFYHKNPSTLWEIFYHAKWVGKRRYKFGFIGLIAGLARASVPFSIIVGLYKGAIYREIRFLVFKIVYDFGVFIGLLDYVFTGNSSK